MNEDIDMELEDELGSEIDENIDENPKKKKKGKKAKKVKGTKKVKKSSGKKPSKRLSRSGKYKSIRHLMETVLKNSKDISFDSAKAKVKAEYPSSAFNESHLSWYKYQILSKGKTKKR